MKRYSLLLESTLPETFQGKLEKIREKVICEDCSTCDMKDECEKHLYVSVVGIVEDDDWKVLEAMAKVHSQKDSIFFIALIDVHTDIMYVYKYDGDISKIKAEKLQKIEVMYKYIKGDDLFLSDIKDLRDIIKFVKTANDYVN